MIQFIKDFLKLQAASSILLLFTLLFAMMAANSPLAPFYEVLHAPVVSHCVNDGLMVIFFLLIGIEIKREMMEGELATRGQALLPLGAAIGGVMVPAIIYTIFNADNAAQRGWAIPSATDIAFSLGIIAVFGERLPASLRVFLMAVAVIDDLIAVVIIALFYSTGLSWPELAMVTGCAILLFVYNRKLTRMTPYLFAGVAMWVAILDSGIHPSVAGILFAFLLPLPLGKKLLHILHPWVAFGVVPVFAFVNAGISLADVDWDDMTHTLALGIAAGLFIGKQIGVFLGAMLMIFLGLSKFPREATPLQFYGVCMVTGIGFTMSLFIGSLAFASPELMLLTRVGVLAGSIASAVGGSIVLAISLLPPKGTK